MKTKSTLKVLVSSIAVSALLLISNTSNAQDLISCTQCSITPNYTFNTSNNNLTIVDMVIQNNGWYNATAYDFAVIIKNVNTGIEYEVDRVTYSGLNYQQDEVISNYMVNLNFHPNVPSGQYRVQGRINDNQNAYETNYSNNTEYFGNASFIYTAATGVEEANAIVTSFTSFPNPGNDQVNLNFSLVKSTTVSLNIADISGRTVRSVNDNATMDAGKYSMNVSTAELPSGVYFMTLITGELSVTRRLVIAH